MQYRNIVISKAKELTIKNSQLIIDQENDISFPLEDINSIIVENQHTMISSYALRLIAENDIACYICDDKHIPSAVLLPMEKHSRHFKMLKAQMEIPKPLQKQIWQSIISKKIENQANCLRLLEIEGSEKLAKMAAEVKSGDTTHVESKAAAYYFRCLFGDDFSRSDDTMVNSALNYGYAIIRGMIARTIVAYGYEPSLGIWHKSELNSYNLADDFIEPFRPLVDLYVMSYVDTEKEELEPIDKREILRMLNYDMQVDGDNRVPKNCIDLMVASYTSSLENAENRIVLPSLVELREHRYE